MNTAPKNAQPTVSLGSAENILREHGFTQQPVEVKLEPSTSDQVVGEEAREARKRGLAEAHRYVKMLKVIAADVLS